MTGRVVWRVKADHHCNDCKGFGIRIVVGQVQEYEHNAAGSGGCVRLFGASGPPIAFRLCHCLRIVEVWS